jgi:protein-L-isoaspartate O-methyltransferase
MLPLMLLLAQAMPADVSDANLSIDEKERDSREKIPEIVRALGLGPSSVVADIGTGYGYYAVRLAPFAGHVYAQEIDRSLFARLRKRIRAEKLKNVEAVLGTLPAGNFDALLVADVYHEVDDQIGFLQRLKPLLKLGGRLMIIEYSKPSLKSATRARQRKEHNLAPALLQADLAAAGFAVIEKRDPLGPGYDHIPTYFILATVR